MWDEIKSVASVVGCVLMALSLCMSVFTLIHTSSKKRIEDIRKAMGDGDSSLKKAHETFATICERRLIIGSKRMTAMDLRLVALETQVRGLPTHTDLQRINKGVTDLQADVAGNTERTNATFELVKSIQRFLMERK